MVIATVTEAQAREYEKHAWHLGGIKPLLDKTTMRFATDFANVVLKGFVAEYSVVIKKQVVDEIRALAQKKQDEGATDAAFPPPLLPRNLGKIVLTD
jgi:hypothetical protein